MAPTDVMAKSTISSSTPGTARSRRMIASGVAAAVLTAATLVGSGSALAVGTCRGSAIEYAIPAEEQTVSPLFAYDLNHDGIICVSTHGKKTVYSDNHL
jgi:hypothetical protein